MVVDDEKPKLEETKGGAAPLAGPETQSSAPICKSAPHIEFHCSKLDSEIPLLDAMLAHESPATTW